MTRRPRKKQPRTLKPSEPEDQPPRWGAAFRDARLAKAVQTGEEWSKARVARAANMTARTYASIEAGHPTLTTKLDAVAAALGVQTTFVVLHQEDSSLSVHTDRARTRRRSSSSSASPEGRHVLTTALSPAIIDLRNELRALRADLRTIGDLKAIVADASALLEGLQAVAAESATSGAEGGAATAGEQAAIARALSTGQPASAGVDLRSHAGTHR